MRNVCVPARREEDQWPKLSNTPAIVLPTPATQSTRKTILEVDDFRARRADPALRHALRINTVVKLRKDRIVERIVVLRLATNPQAITTPACAVNCISTKVPGLASALLSFAAPASGLCKRAPPAAVASFTTS